MYSPLIATQAMDIKVPTPIASSAVRRQRTSIGLFLGACVLALAWRAFPSKVRDDDAPTFDEVTGRPTNKAAEELFAAATKRGDAPADPAEREGGTSSLAGPECEAFAAVPPVHIARGTWKYVLVSLSAPSCDGEMVVVRNTAGREYHAEMFRDAMVALEPIGVSGHVLGGGRIAYGDQVEVYG